MLYVFFRRRNRPNTGARAEFGAGFPKNTAADGRPAKARRRIPAPRRVKKFKKTSVHTLISLVITPAANNAPADCAAAFAAVCRFFPRRQGQALLPGAGNSEELRRLTIIVAPAAAAAFLFSRKNADFPAVLFFFQKMALFFPKSPPRRFLLYNGANS